MYVCEVFHYIRACMKSGDSKCNGGFHVSIHTARSDFCSAEFHQVESKSGQRSVR